MVAVPRLVHVQPVGSAQARRDFLLLAYIIIQVNAKDKSPPSVPLGKHRATLRVALKRLQAEGQVATRMGLGTGPHTKGGKGVVLHHRRNYRAHTVAHSDCVVSVVSVVWDLHKLL